MLQFVAACDHADTGEVHGLPNRQDVVPFAVAVGSGSEISG
eukprot:COSAG03_NODE_17550_length_373_cov_0.613139_2_plen_40_part_01